MVGILVCCLGWPIFRGELLYSFRGCTPGITLVTRTIHNLDCVDCVEICTLRFHWVTSGRSTDLQLFDFRCGFAGFTNLKKGCSWKTCKQHWTPREQWSKPRLYAVYIGDDTTQLNRELQSPFTNQYFVVQGPGFWSSSGLLKIKKSTRKKTKKTKQLAILRVCDLCWGWWVKTWPEIIRVVLSDDQPNETRPYLEDHPS